MNKAVGKERSKRYWSIILMGRINKVLENANTGDNFYDKRKEKNKKRPIKKINKIAPYLKKQVEVFLRKSFVRMVEKKTKKIRKRKSEYKKVQSDIKKINSEVVIFGRKINVHRSTRKKIGGESELEIMWVEGEEFEDMHESNPSQESSSFPGLEETDDIVIELLFDDLGDGFIEEYMRAKKKVEAIVEKWPSVIIDAIPNDGLTQRVFVAEAVERGAILVSVQHGGWYGEVGYYGLEWVEKQISDVFATWGYENDDIDVGLPALKLMNDRCVDPEGETLLWLSRSVDHWGGHLSPVTFFDVIDGANGPNEGKSRFERATKLYDKLARDVKGNLLLRFDYKLRPDTEGHMRMLKWRIRKRFKQAKMDRKRRKLEERLGNARLVLVDHVPSTVFAECIHGGVPTILFDRIDEKWLTDNARQAYQALEDAGILYQNPEAAARKINEVYPDPLDWWNSTQVTAAVNQYKKEFAYVGERPVKEWAEFLEDVHEQNSQ
jgi:putative transferase (TIGR04331 family)